MAVNVFPAPSSGGAGPLKFVLQTGTSGNRTFTLAEAVPAGTYSFTSALGDTAYDIYFLDKNGLSVGYSKNGLITATAPIEKVVILGSANSDTWTFERSQTIQPATNGDALGAGAFITDANPKVLAAVNASTTITGGNFATDVEVYFRGVDNVVTQAKSVTRNSATQLVAVRPDTFPEANGPYDLIILNPGVTPPTGSNAHILTDVISASSILATGGTIVQSGGYVYHTFTASGTFTPSTTINNAELLVVAGGGGGSSADGAAGGAGGIWFKASNTFTATPVTVTVGAGGGNRGNGSNSSFGTLGVAIGGGTGGWGWEGEGPSTAGASGGSGGGSCWSGYGPGGSTQGSTNGGTGYGNAGGGGGAAYSGGGGGGAGQAGQAATGSAGGNGLNTWATWATATGTGESGYYAGGGGKSGGLGGGGPLNGSVNTGGGGGGQTAGGRGDGGSGIVIVRYPA